jgi:hypothetical protein
VFRVRANPGEETSVATASRAAVSRIVRAKADAVYRVLEAAGRALTEDELVARTGLSPASVRSAADRLRERGLVEPWTVVRGTEAGDAPGWRWARRRALRVPPVAVVLVDGRPKSLG